MNQRLVKIEVYDSMKPVVAYLAAGRNADLEAQLIAKSRQANILKFTPKDSTKRFKDAEALEHWFEKGREIHWLLNASNDLAGIIWYGKSEFPLDIQLPETPRETFAIRLYDGYAGHGLAKPFMRLSLEMLVKQKRERHEPVPGIWLQTDITNPAAVAAYTKFGYQEVARDAQRITMALPSKQILEMI